MKILYTLLTAIFLLFCAFQYNDPDPAVWIFLYGYAAVISFFMIFGKIKTIVWPLIGLLIFVISAVVDWPDTFKGMENSMTIMRPEIEKARETLGMLICAVTMLFYIIMVQRRKTFKSL